MKRFVRQILVLFLFIFTYSVSGVTPLQLTVEEQQWLKQHPVVTIGVDHSFPPFEYITDDGKYMGSAADYLKLIQARLGIRFEHQVGLSWRETVQRAKARDIDVLPCVGITAEPFRLGIGDGARN